MDINTIMILLIKLVLVYTLTYKKVLSNKIIPFHYNLHFTITPDLFEGTTEIYFKTKKKTKKVILNAEDLDIQSINLFVSDKVFQGTFFSEKNTVDIFFHNPLLTDEEYKLEIKYRSKYSEGMDGIYKSNYNDNTLYSTHFEPTYARKAFPCFDQPDMKARFRIKITAPPDNIVLSNSSLNKKDGNTYLFNDTEPMSTYLVAFVVGKLESIQMTTKNNKIPITIYADKSDIKNGRLAINVAKYALDFFENYFDIKYPFPKLDLVAIPEFAMGAMENWGLVTFRKTSLLYNPATDATASKIRVIDTVCHELAHMWFGNLVTMNWWNDLWLNEGFATWAATMAIYNLPKNIIDFDIWLNFINMTLEEGMSYDSLHSTHPVAVEVQDPDEINQIFDLISYNKGASLIRMIENFVGHESFRKSIQKYLKHFKYSNAESNDFFTFQENSKLTTRMANSWLNQEGFPLLSVKEENNNLIITQTRFFAGTKNQDEKNWIIPVTIQFKDNAPQVHLMSQNTLTISVQSKIYKLNLSNVGFYRVLYPKDVMERTFNFFSSNKDRLNFINDLFALAFGGYVDIAWVVKIITNVSKDYDYESMKSIIGNLKKLYQIYYSDDEQATYIKDTIALILKKHMKYFEEDTNSISTKLFSGLLLNSAVFINDQNVSKRFKSFYKIFRSGRGLISPDYVYAMFVSVVDDNLDEIIQLSKTSPISNIRLMAMKALGAVQEEENISKVLNLYEELERQNLSYYFLGLSMNIKFKNRIIGYFINNYNKIKTYVNNESIINTSMAHVLCGVFDSDIVANISGFLNNIDNNLTVKKILETNTIFADFKKRNPKPFLIE